jgi:peroxiredoxin
MRLYWAILCSVFGLCSAALGGPSQLVLKDLAGVPRHPLEPAEKLASVLIFYWHDCPVCNGYAPELDRIYAAHTNFAFYIVQVAPELSPEAAKEHARQYELRAPVLLDPQHRLVKLVRATVAPEAVVVGKHGEVLYRGRINDRYFALGKARPEATQNDLRDALDDIAAGRPVKETETEAVGCIIQSPGGGTEGKGK